jgi:hypothetical protein
LRDAKNMFVETVAVSTKTEFFHPRWSTILPNGRVLKVSKSKLSTITSYNVSYKFG